MPAPAAPPSATAARPLKGCGLVAAERRRIAREIHDGVAQDLAALSLKIRLAQQQPPTGAADPPLELDEIRAILDTSLVELRRIIRGLRPVSLEECGFIPALHALAADFNAEHSLYVHLTISGDAGHLPAALELPLFRMAQEALHNIAQHAQATRACMTLTLTAAEVSLAIGDDGRGFTADTVRDKIRTGHLGLQQMQERIAAHDGRLSIQSEVGEGTYLTAVFPRR